MSAAWQDDYAAHMMRTFGVPERLLVRGQGCWVEDSAGEQLLDFLAGIAVNALGHAHPELVRTISEQAGTLVHVSNFFATEPQLTLAARLLALSGATDAGRVFFANSGTEANEAAFKLARLHGGQGRPVILALDLGFHGRTMGALALTGKPAMREPFEPMPAGVQHIAPTIAALEAALTDQVAALVVEPIQGEAGVRPLPEGFLERARELTLAHGVLLIVDEIQTGIARTGAMFGFQHAGILPDAITLAKGLGGGLPIGALVALTPAAADLFAPGMHGTAFGGTPLAAAAANTVLDVVERDGLVAAANREGQRIRDVVAGLGSPLVAGVRGSGLLLGVELSQPVAPAAVAAALAAGLIVNAPDAQTVRLAPPLIVGEAEIAVFAERFAAALATVEAGLAIEVPAEA